MKNKPINITPSWRTSAGWCLIALDIANEKGKEIAREEIRKMADLLDAQVVQEHGQPPNPLLKAVSAQAKALTKFKHQTIEWKESDPAPWKE